MSEVYIRLTLKQVQLRQDLIESVGEFHKLNYAGLDEPDFKIIKISIIILGLNFFSVVNI
jgi:hypothetical protein